MANKKLYKLIEKNTETAGEVTIQAEIPAEIVSEYRTLALKQMSENIELDGFRKGKAPEDMIIKHVGEFKVLEQAAYQAIEVIFPTILGDEKIDALTQPNITITKVAPENPVEFKATIVLMPEVSLPDYKKIAKEIAKNTEEDKVTDKEVDEYIKQIQTMRAQALQKAEVPEGEDAQKDDTKDKELDLPKLDDDFVKTLGDFKDVDDFKSKLKENMLVEKHNHAMQKKRLDIIEGILKDTTITLPEILIEEEQRKMLGQFKHDVERMKMEFEDYLKEIKKTEEELLTEWKPDAEKRAKMNLILPKIAAAEKLQPNPDEITEEVKKLKEHHSDLDDMHATMYVASILTNEEVFKFLETL